MARASPTASLQRHIANHELTRSTTTFQNPALHFYFCPTLTTHIIKHIPDFPHRSKTFIHLSRAYGEWESMGVAKKALGGISDTYSVPVCDEEVGSAWEDISGPVNLRCWCVIENEKKFRSYIP